MKNFDFSIESSIGKINNLNTKEYFTEVYQTYVNGNFRSSVVMLYSVLICDLIFKLRDLRDIYQDETAKNILDEVEQIQEKNPKSADWENKLIENINNRTSLIDTSLYASIEYLQKTRHLSAHPVLTNSDLLYTPNRETIQSLIRNMLEGIFTNPPYFSNKIFDNLVDDLSRDKEKLADNEELTIYLNSRYFKQLKPVDFSKLFRSLWKVVFVINDEKCKKNRNINFDALTIMINTRKELCHDKIEMESDFFSRIKEEECLSYLIKLLASFPEIYSYLNESLKIILKSTINENEIYKFVGWFVTGSLKDHLLSLNEHKFLSLQKNVIVFMKSISTKQNCLDDFIDFVLGYFKMSDSWQESLNRFENAIEVLRGDLSLEQTQKLLETSNNNNQIYGSWGVPEKIQSIIDDGYLNEIDKTKYEHIFFKDETIDTEELPF